MAATVELLEKTVRLHVLKSATGGPRVRVEQRFAKALTPYIRDNLAEMATVARQAGLLQRAYTGGRAAVAGYTRLTDRRHVATEYLVNLFPRAFATAAVSHEEERAVAKVAERYILDAFEVGAVEALHAMGFRASGRRYDATVRKAAGDIVFELTDEELIAALQERAREVGRGLTPTMLGDFRNMVRDRMVLGDAKPEEMGREIAIASGIPEWRGLKIARTEAGSAYNTAQFEQYHRSGVRRKSWVNVGDMRVRQGHVLNSSDGWILMEKPFSTGAMHPGDGTDSINCRCSLQADLSDPEILITPWDGGGGPWLRPVGPLAPLPPKSHAVSSQMLARLRAARGLVTKPRFTGPLGKDPTRIKDERERIRAAIAANAEDPEYVASLERRLAKLDARLAEVEVPPLTYAEARAKDISVMSDDAELASLKSRLTTLRGEMAASGRPGAELAHVDDMIDHVDYRIGFHQRIAAGKLTEGDSAYLWATRPSTIDDMELLRRRMEAAGPELERKRQAFINSMKWTDQRVASLGRQEDELRAAIKPLQQEREQIAAAKDAYLDNPGVLRAFDERIKELTDDIWAKLDEADELAAEATKLKARREANALRHLAPKGAKARLVTTTDDIAHFGSEAMLAEEEAKKSARASDRWFRGKLSSRHAEAGGGGRRTVRMGQLRPGEEQRAFCREQDIYVTKSAPLHTTIHETGHALEHGNPEHARMAQAFLRHRVDGQEWRAVQLNKKFPDWKVKDHEWGWAGPFDKAFGNNPQYSSYTAKYYHWGGTEISSMGIELMYVAPERLATQDPEFFRFLVGIMDGSLL